METELTSTDVQKNLIESALFMATKPLQLDELIRISGIGSLGYLKDAIKGLQKDYSEKGLEIIETPEGWQMKVKKEYLPSVASLTPHSDLSEGCKKTLALVLYHEPLKQSELVKTQGTKAYVYVKELEKRGLLKSERKGHTKLLKITSEFENYFGDTKESVKKRLVEAMENLDLAGLNPAEENEKQKTLEEFGEKPKEAEREILFSFLDNQSVPFKNKIPKEKTSKLQETPEDLPFSFLDKKISQTSRIRIKKAEDAKAPAFSLKNKNKIPKETRNEEKILTEDDEALEDPKPKNLKPIKREKPVKIKIKKSGKENGPGKAGEKRPDSKPINKIVAKQDLSGVKELTVEDLKK